MRQPNEEKTAKPPATPKEGYTDRTRGLSPPTGPMPNRDKLKQKRTCAKEGP